MEVIQELAGLDDFKDILDSPVITNSKKKDIFTAILKGNIQDLTYNMVMLTISNNRESFLPGIARCYIDEADKYNGITRVKLTTAVTVNDDARGNLRNVIENDLNTKVELEEIIDPEITGGFILKVEDMFIDASVKTGLRKIKSGLIKK